MTETHFGRAARLIQLVLLRRGEVFFRLQYPHPSDAAANGLVDQDALLGNPVGDLGAKGL